MPVVLFPNGQQTAGNISQSLVTLHLHVLQWCDVFTLEKRKVVLKRAQNMCPSAHSSDTNEDDVFVV